MHDAIVTGVGGWGRIVHLSNRGEGWIDKETNRSRVHGHWPSRLAEGQRIEADMASGRRIHGNLIGIEWQLDPADMFFAEVEWVGYVDERP